MRKKKKVQGCTLPNFKTHSLYSQGNQQGGTGIRLNQWNTTEDPEIHSTHTSSTYFQQRQQSNLWEKGSLFKKKGAKKKLKTYIKMGEERNLNLKKAYIQFTHTLKKKNLLQISF